MTSLGLRFDFRAPSFGASAVRLYGAALEMASFADGAGFDYVQVSEHHGAQDGYCPSPTVAASALAARTSRVGIRISALLLPLYHPLRLAEDLAVLDLVSGGRLQLVIGAGYRAAEFDALGADFDRRGRAVEEGVGLLRSAWTGEPFSFGGRRVMVTPRPAQRPHPLLLLGGSSAAPARRAARLGVGFLPTHNDLYEVYRSECARLGRVPAPPIVSGPYYLHVAEDPVREWGRLGPHLVHDAGSYGAWLREAGATGSFVPVDSIEEVRRGGKYVIATPDECVALIDALGPHGQVMLHPLVAGADPEAAQRAVELFASKVIPAVRASARGQVVDRSK